VQRPHAALNRLVDATDKLSLSMSDRDSLESEGRGEAPLALARQEWACLRQVSV
jgi:hypothetical protein